jgi:hypothetical protein
VHIQQHGGVDVPAAQREIVDTEHGDPADGGLGQRAQQVQQRVPPDRHTNASASRAPARPARATAIEVSAARNGGL